jgi:hypothetical protein
MDPKEYQPVEQVDANPEAGFELEEQAPFLSPSQGSGKLANVPARWPWILSTAVLFVIATILLFWNQPQCSFGKESYEAGFTTDLGNSPPTSRI